VLDQDRRLRDKVHQLCIGTLWVAQVKLVIVCSFMAQHITDVGAHALNQRLNSIHAGRILEVFHRGRLRAAFADEHQRVARMAASGVVVRGDVGHGACDFIGQDLQGSQYPCQVPWTLATALNDSHAKIRVFPNPIKVTFLFLMLH